MTQGINFLKTYLWHALAISLRFLSIFVVAPYIAKDVATFGIYTICMSVTLLLNYADLGFMRSSQKYAAESYARGRREEEIIYIGFGSFVLFVFTVLCALVFTYLSFNPKLLINGFSSADDFLVASRLLLILAIFTPIAVLQRIVFAIYDIRLEGFIPQRVFICASLITLSTVFVFFGNGNYQMVAYFLSSQLINMCAIFICLYLARQRFNYSLMALISRIRFSNVVYIRTKKLAISGLYVMLAWLIYYEFDAIVIGKLLDAENVAIYSIGFTFAVLFRVIYGVYFSPFMTRANHIVGYGDDNDLRAFLLKTLLISAPFVLLPTLAIALVAKPFIVSWVGERFIKSADLAVYFALMFTFSFVSYITTIMLVAKVRVRAQYIVATFQMIAFWVGVFATYSSLGVMSFAIFKFITTFLAEVFYFFILARFLEVPPKILLLKLFRTSFPSLLVLICFLLVTRVYIPIEMSKSNLMIIVFVVAVGLLLSFAVEYLFNPNVRALAKRLGMLLKDVAV